jgi:hypothetical protein
VQPELVPCQLVEFDHIISKAKLTDEDKFQDFVNPVTKTEVSSAPCVVLQARSCIVQCASCGKEEELLLLLLTAL